jgi:hypothetical protein
MGSFYVFSYKFLVGREEENGKLKIYEPKEISIWQGKVRSGDPPESHRAGAFS